MGRLEDHFPAFRKCGTVEQESPLTEPNIITSTFITGGAIEVTQSAVRIVGWEELATVNGEMAEKRIVSRIVMTNATARDVLTALKDALSRGGH